MKLAIMQPTFLPWMGYFDLIDAVDTFIFLDTVQLNQQSWQTRNRIKVQENELLFSVPIVKDKSKKELLIKNAKIDLRRFDFRKKLLKTLEQNYRKAAYFDDVHNFISDLICYDTSYLSEYNINFIVNISKKLGIDTQLITLSRTESFYGSHKGKLVLDICQSYHCQTYISPMGAKEYLEPLHRQFENAGIDIRFQHYRHPIYPQLGKEFLPFMGIVDLIYNTGFENSLQYIREGRGFEDR